MRVVRFYVSLLVFVLRRLLVVLLRPCDCSLNRDHVSSVWRAGPQPRSCEFSVARRTSTAILWHQCSAPDLNRDPVRSVFRAGPQPRSCEISVPRRTSTAILWDQCSALDLIRDPVRSCSAPDLNRDPVSVFRAGPQPRSCEISVSRWTSTAILSERMWEDMSERMSEDVSERMWKDVSKRMSKDMSERISEDMSERMSVNMTERVSRDMPERMSEDMSERVSRDMPERMSEDMSERMSEDMSERMSEDMSERMSEDMSERMAEDMSERMSVNISDRMSEDVCYGSQGECLWVMLHKTNNFAIGNAAKLMLCHLMWGTAANTCGSTFRVQASEVGLAAMSELVVERPATIFIGTSSRFAKGVGYVWRYVLTTVGAERIYVCMEPPSTTHASDCMFIVPEVVEGTLWYVAYEGRAVPTEEGQQNLEQRSSLSNFGVVLGGWSARVANQCCAEQSHLHRREARATVARVGPHGLHTLWDVVAAVCSLVWHLGTQLLFWRGCLMHVVWVLLQALCIFGLNCFLAGLSDAAECNCRIAIWQTQSCHGYYFCCVV